MIRFPAFALLLLAATPASAQSTDIHRAMRGLAAIWRPIAANARPEAVQAACAGAIEELGTVDAMLPSNLTQQNLARVRAPRGLIVIPTGDEPSAAYFFPPADLPWFASGLGALSVVSEREGRLLVHDAAGADIALQLGTLGATPALRISPAGAPAQTFVGCAPTLTP